MLGLGGATYTPVNGMQTSARQRLSALKASNFEARGIISTDTISDEDLRSGLYRDAKITEYLVNWHYPFAAPVMSSSYWMETTTWNGEHWDAQFAGIAQRFKRKVGGTYTRQCRHTLGDTLCTVATNLITETGEVDTVVSSLRSFTDTSLDNSTDDYYAYGYLTWTSGANEGVSVEVLSYTGASGTIALAIPMAHTIQVGDTYTLFPGCDKTLDDCKNKYNNVINYGGFPHMPGNDALFKKPELGGATGDTSSG